MPWQEGGGYSKEMSAIQIACHGTIGHHLPDLLTDQVGLAHLRVRLVGQPLADKQLTQERVEGLLLTAQLLATAAVLLMQGGEEPLEDEESPLFGIGLSARSDEDGRVLSPVGRVLGERGGGQDERRGGQGGEITVE